MEWLQGRNQALFATQGTAPTLLVQPWLGMVAALGAPRFTRKVYHCYDNHYDTLSVSEKWAHRHQCGPNPRNSTITLSVVDNYHKGFGGARLLDGAGVPIAKRHHRTIRARAVAQARASESGGRLGEMYTGGSRISTTANLVHIRRSNAAEPCTAYLGIGHIHRGEGVLNRRKDAQRRHTGREAPGHRTGTAWSEFTLQEEAFQFGSQYTHFFYTLSSRPPYSVIGTSSEFCIRSSQDPDDCESVQFVSGLALVAADDYATLNHTQRSERADSRSPRGAQLLLSYGVNDCEAKLAHVSLERIWGMLKPLSGKLDGDVCVV
jgi:hypothetical protein